MSFTLEIRNKSAAAAQPNPIAINNSMTAATIPAALLLSLNFDNAVIMPLKNRIKKFS